MIPERDRIEFELWAGWRDRGGLRAERPKGLRARIPALWWAAYLARKAARLAEARRNAFRGAGMLAVPGWESVDEIVAVARHLRWVAVLARTSTPGIVAEIKARAGCRVYVWEDENSSEGAAAVRRLGADPGYIGQAEGIEQERDKARHAAALDAAGISRALVSSVSYGIHPDGTVDPWPLGWGGIPEVYTQANPQATTANMVYALRRRGGDCVSLCFGLYVEGQQERMTLVRYRLEAIATVPDEADDWNGFRVGTLDPADLVYIAGLPANR